MSFQRFSRLAGPALTIGGLLWVVIYMATVIIGVVTGQFEPRASDAHRPLIVNLLVVLGGNWFLPLSTLILSLGLLAVFAELEGRARVLGITGLVFASIALILSTGNLIVLSGIFGSIGRSLVFPNNSLGGFAAFTTSIGTGFLGGAVLRAHLLPRWMAWILIIIGIVTIPILLATPLPTSIAPAWATDTIAFLLSGIGYTAVGVRVLAKDRKAVQQQVSLSARIE
jgi:hypothetical protein